MQELFSETKSSFLRGKNAKSSGQNRYESEWSRNRKETHPKLSQLRAPYVRDSRAANTRRAYASDLQHFVLWGGGVPASPELVANYIAFHADHLAPATLNRRLASIGYSGLQLSRVQSFAPSTDTATRPPKGFLVKLLRKSFGGGL